jgi:uncharacterized protein YndB with AHSA1/START domain
VSTTGTATASVEVNCDPQKAFDVFTKEIGRWWKRGTYYWIDKERGQEYRFEPRVGGRLVEVYDLDTGEGAELGRVRTWEPGSLLEFTWRTPDWPEGVTTLVSVRFAASVTGTVVTVEHSGWDAVGPDGAAMASDYSGGWGELLGFYRDAT